MRLAISPCPNDTFLYESFAHNLVNTGGTVLFHDIAELNAFSEHPDPPELIKVSCASAPLFLDRYRVLPAGGAFAEAVGPLVLRHQVQAPWTTTLLPGWRTSAHILFRYWQEANDHKRSQEHFARFDTICQAITQDQFDAGVVIHESRFTYGDLSLTSLVDLGVFWHQATQLPVPLGCAMVRRDLSPSHQQSLLTQIRESVKAAWQRQDPLTPWISQHAQELAPEVQRNHIATYVTPRSFDCGQAGIDALRTLWNCADRLVEPWPISESQREAALLETQALLLNR